ncbi:MAG: hypothetical protein ABEI39_01590 [Halobacteriales archaeon]
MGEIGLEEYVNQIRNTIHAAYEAGHPHGEIYSEVESLLFELRGDHSPQIDSKDAFARELDGLLTNAYIATDDAIEVLEEKAEDLEGIGEEAPEELYEAAGEDP